MDAVIARQLADSERTAPALLAVSSTLALVLWAVAGSSLEALPLRVSAVAILVNILVVGTGIAMSGRQGVWSPAALYFVVLTLFHAGLFLQPALSGGQAAFLSGQYVGWYTDQSMAAAATIVGLGISAYGAAYGFWQATARTTPWAPPPAMRGAQTIPAVGAVAVIVSGSAWYALSAMDLGPLFFLGSYESFLSGTADVALGITYLGISVGAAFMGQGLRMAIVRVALGFLGAFVAMALASGLRSPALIPVVALVAVAALRRSPAAVVFFGAIVLALVGVALVQQIREGGLALTDASALNLSPLGAIEEMGYTVRAVITSWQWHELAHEPYLWGGSYWAPIERPLALILDVPRYDADMDFRLMNVEIAQRVGQIGGSIFAEAHHNFGRVGVVLVGAIAGSIMWAVGNARVTPVRLALGGILVVLALMHVRNSFTPLVSWGFAGLAGIGLALALGVVGARLTRSRG